MSKCAGIFPVFDNGKTVLLGKEYRERYDAMLWMSFGGKQDPNESLAETACREFNEETAFVFRLDVQRVIDAENLGHYIDYLNPKTGVFYRMYIVSFSEKPDISEFLKSRQFYPEFVEKIEWKYFRTRDVIFDTLGAEFAIYETEKVRYNLLKDAQFFKHLLI